MLAREGDFIQHKSNVIFDVKGLIHPKDKIVAFPRYIPDQKGPRQNKGISYDKVYSLADRFKFLQEHLPHLILFDNIFGETMCEVPTNEITCHFQPQKKLACLHTEKSQTLLEEKALQLATDLQQNANIPWSAIGISGSILAGLTTPTSDIDLIIYGEDISRKAYLTMQQMLNEKHPHLKAYTKEELRVLYDFRSKDTHMSFKDFQQVENRKAFQGMYKNTDYFIRFIKDWPELHEQYGDICYSNAGYTKITAEITNKTEALFTPCTYQIENVKIIKGPQIAPIKEIFSFRGRFCEQAENNEIITAQGKTELVVNKKNGTKYYRLILGSNPEDYMILNTL
jgi:predicted nucleotidyltransferase